MNMMKKNGGFTLVELIVVIAILAILAGVAVPAYSGYMDKAKEAADTQILSAMNTAFAAACVENELMPKDVTATATISSGAVTLAVSDPSASADAIVADFNGYFGTGNSFGYYTTLTQQDDGNFVGSK